MKERDIQIEELAEHFTFEELSKDEQSKVLEMIDKESYGIVRKTILGSKVLFKEDINNIEPKPENIERLLDIVEDKDRKKFGALLLHNIPFYQAAAACLLAVLFTYLFVFKPTPDNVVVEKEEAIFKIVTDTIIKEVFVTDTVEKQNLTLSPKKKVEKLGDVQYLESRSYARQEFVKSPEMDEIAKSFGNTSVNSDLLEKFKVQL